MTGATVAAAAPVRPRRRTARETAVLAAQGVGVVLVVVATTLAATGWLDLLRRSGVSAGVGPRLPEGLPLQRLAGNAGQPLLRVVLAWAPAGLFAGAALRAIGVRARALRAGIAFAGCALFLMVLGGLADAVTESLPLLSQMGAQPGRAVIWVAAVLAGAGAAAPRGGGRPAPPAGTP